MLASHIEDWDVVMERVALTPAETGRHFKLGSLVVWDLFTWYIISDDAVTRHQQLNGLPGGLAASSAPWIYMMFMNAPKENRRGGGESGGAEEAIWSHYSVMDCMCHTVSALFIPSKLRPRPPRTFPYPSEIYHVRAGGTWGTALRAPDRCSDLPAWLNKGLQCE